MWASQEKGSDLKLVMQTDGNVVIYDSEDNAIWSSRRLGTPSGLVLDNDGQLASYDSSNKILWSSVCQDKLLPGQVLYQGEKLCSQNGGFEAVLQKGDGNFVIYKKVSFVFLTHEVISPVRSDPDPERLSL